MEHIPRRQRAGGRYHDVSGLPGHRLRGVQDQGIPRGRVIEIFGPESSGKTTLALHVAAQAQKAGGIAAIIDAEHAFDPTWGKKLGVQLDTLLVSQPNNGEEAMRRLSEETPDLILMDVVMPGLNGFQLTRAITRDPRFANVPVIMCTSKNQETDKVWGMRQGARDYIVKPVNRDELIAKIHSMG